jgi:hypothetical protein
LKYSTVKAGISFSFVRVVKALTHLSRPFFSRSSLDTDTSQTYLIFLMLHACLYTICFVFCYTSWRFYAFSGTNLLTRRHSASSLFSAVFVFQKSYTGNILGIGRNKSRTSYFHQSFAKTKYETEGGHSRSYPRVAWPRPWPRHQGVSRPSPPPDAALLPIYSPRWAKPKRPINFPRNILQAAAIIDLRSGGSRSSSWHPAGEGNPCRRPSPPPWSPPE